LISPTKSNPTRRIKTDDEAQVAEAFQAADAKARELGWHLKDHGNCYAKADQASCAYFPCRIFSKYRRQCFKQQWERAEDSRYPGLARKR
jgi:hypothetical protein